MDILTTAARLGIVAEFSDGRGQWHAADPNLLRTIVAAMPDAPQPALLSDVPVAREGMGGETALRADVAYPVRWTLRAGSEDLAHGVVKDGAAIHWPGDLARGVYRVALADASGREQETSLLVAPPHAYRGDFERIWLLAVQLYAVRSARNWGIGDFTDLLALTDRAAESGASGIGLNPLHALFDDRPGDCSPYSPSSRLFLNPLYIDVAALPELPADFAARHAVELTRLREAAFVDYPAVAALKWAALREAFARFQADPLADRSADLDAFRNERGAVLARYACFEVLRHRLAKPWWDWPEAWRAPDPARLELLRAGEDSREIAFIEFVQWCADRQLAACQSHALRLGMKVGLYLDVAVGVQTDGFDAWDEQVAVARQLSIGAPPDVLNTAGQNWGLAGFNAAGLVACDFAPFREMMRASMRHAGAIRLDHVLGLNRLYVVPHGYPASAGVYVRMPLQALLAVVAQESVAERCVVIGEDLGTVPDGFRETMAQWGLWSYRVLMFERAADGGFYGPEHYPPESLVTFSTHDLPTFEGWRTCHDIAVKRGLGLDPGEDEAMRREALAAFARTATHHGAAQDGFPGVVSYLATTGSRLMVVAIDDLLGLVDQPNVPGTVNEHPNWRRRIPVPLEDWGGAVDWPTYAAALAGRTAGA